MLELIITALFFGFASSTHCVSMCGGLALAGVAPEARARLSVIYSAGRLLSYAMLGAFAGYIGDVVTPSAQSMVYLRLFGALFVVLMGLYVLGWTWALNWLEAIAKRVLWSKIQPLAQRTFPARSAGTALFAGALWGLLPCGMVYSALTWSATSGQLTSGALVMFAFGLGTLPAILSLSFLPWLADLMRKPYTKKILGVLLVSAGLFNAVQGVHKLVMSPSPEMPAAHHHMH